MTIFGEIRFTKHALERYEERIGIRYKMSATESLKKDLHYKRIKKIVDKKDTKHVFTIGKTEYIFIKKERVLVLKTVIKHTRRTLEDKQQKVMREKRQKR